MQKIYVLLRNDQQTGPYSLQEIIQFDLKPYDLIWIEGKSAGWYYPQEIGDLRPYLRFLPQKPAVQNHTAPKPVFVSVPPAPIKEEAPVIVPLSQKVEAPRHNDVSPVGKNLEEEVYAQFRKPPEAILPAVGAISNTPSAAKKKPAISVGVALTSILVVGGVFAASWVMNRHSNEDEITPAETLASAPVQEVAATAPATSDKQTQNQHLFAKAKQKQQPAPSLQRQTTVALKQAPAPKQTVERSGERTAASGVAIEEPATTAKETPVASQDEPAAVPEETAAPQEKKKKLRDKIFDIFRKKPEEQKTEEAQPSETTNGERRSTHRESGASLAQMVSIRFTVPNDWMMGIKGAKATLVNRSSQRVEKATVEVLYYNDDNELLQKKLIIFSKVDEKDSKTIAIPDHASATRVDYNLVSVTGEPGA